MAVYPNMLTTVAGFNLIARSNATGKALIFTRGALGDGDANDKTITSLTNLVAPKMPNLAITNKRDNGNGHFTIEASVDSSTLEAGFWAREMGVFAKCEGDETDVLYAYTNGGNLVPYVNDKTMPDIQLMQVDVIVGNAKNLSVTIDNSVYITEARLRTHDESPDAHKIAFDKFRLDSNGLYVPKTGGAITGDLDVQGNLSVITQTLEDYGVNAANTKWVQDFVKNYVGSNGAVRASYGETGFRVFNDRFCIQWGVISIDSLKIYKVTYPLKLSNLLYAAVFNWDWNDLTSKDEVHSFTIRVGDGRQDYFVIAPSYATQDTRWILFGTVE